MKAVSKNKPLSHYKWGNHCDGWNLVAEESVSVKQERMPPGASEKWHHHKYAQQFFYILKGSAVFEVDGSKVELEAGEGILIEAGKKHRISNQTENELEFLVVSQPTTLGDRIPDEE